MAVTSSAVTPSVGVCALCIYYGLAMTLTPLSLIYVQVRYSSWLRFKGSWGCMVLRFTMDPPNLV